MKSIRKNGFKGIAVAAALSMTMTTMVSPAATAIPTGRWEQSMQTGVWKYRNVTGEYLADQWFLYEGKWYRFDKDGNMITGWYQNPETKNWYYLWENGSMATGWVPVNGRWYYLTAGSGEMAHDVTTPDGYKVNADGAWVDANGKAYDAPNGDQKTTTSKRSSGGSDGSSDSDSDSGSHSSGNNSSNSGNSGNGGNNGSNSGNVGNNGSNSGNNGSDSGNNGNAGNNGSNSENNGNTGDNETPEEKTLVVESQTKLVDLGWSQYVTVAFAKGYSLDNSTLTVDGEDVTDAFTKVDKDGTLAKWEITSLNPAKLVVKGKDGETQTVVLSENADPETPKVRENTAPAAFLAHGSVYVWDYQLDNYDEDGTIRQKPKTTTFDLGEEKNGIRYYAPAAELTEDPTNRYGVGGQAVVMFNYTEAVDKQWFDEITNVALVSGNGYNQTINNELQYEKTTGDHYGNTVGQILVPLGQKNFYSNGSYYLRVTSGGKNTLIPIEVVNGTAPSMVLKEAGAIKSGQNIHFDVKNMTYGVEVPITGVELMDPAGKTTELEMIRDWYLIGNTFVLYNDENATDGRNNIPYAGEYTVTVHATGFKDMSYVFAVSEGTSAQSEAAAVDIYAIDAVSSASVSGGTTSGSGNAAEGGSTTMSADLLFDADLLTNALVLTKLGVENESAQAIADRWKHDMSGWDAVIGEDGTTFYSFAEYRDAVEKAKVDGKYLSFADYIKSENAVTTQNRPYAVKYVLEDNRLGATIMNGAYLGKTAPKLILVDENGNMINEVLEDQDVRIRCEDAAYLQNISDNGKIYINGSYEAVNKEDYTIDDKVLVLDKSLFSIDKDNNKVTIKVDRYQDKVFNVAIAKDVKNVTLKVGEDLKTGKEVTITNTADETGDIWKNIQSVVLVKPDGTRKTLLTDGAEGKNIGYAINGNVLTLGSGLFTTGGNYSVEIFAQYYGRKTVEFTVEKTEVDNGGNDGNQMKAAPQIESIELDYFKDFNLKFGSSAEEWVKNIQTITVNETPYESGSVWNNNKYSTALASDGTISLGNGSFTQECNEVVISADGYENLILEISKDGKLVTGDSENGNNNNGSDKNENDKNQAPLTATVKKYSSNYWLTFAAEDAAWLGCSRTVKVNGTLVSNGYGNGQYYADTNSRKIKLWAPEFDKDGKIKLVISVDGYNDFEICFNTDGEVVTDGGNDDSENTGKIPPQVTKTEKEMFGTNYSIYVSLSETTWMEVISEVTVNGDPYSPALYSVGENEYKVRESDGKIDIDGTDFQDVNVVVISAEGYEDLEVMIDKKGDLITENTTTVAAEVSEMISVEENQISEEKKEIVSKDVVDDEISNNEEEIIKDTKTEESSEIEESEDTVEIKKDASIEFVLDEASEL